MQGTITFLKEAWVELGKVVWPTRHQAVRLTVAVLAVTFGVAAFAAMFDYLFSQVLGFLIQT